MPHVGLGWQQAAITAMGLTVLAAGLIRTRHARLVASGRFAGEAALLLGLFALWMYAGSFALLPSSGGLPRGRWLWHAERVLHLPSEVAVQHPFLPHPLLVEAFNLYYAVLHFPVLIGTLIWLFVWHRGHYRHVRTTVVLVTGASLLIQFVPVAPPRMLTGTGLVDTAARYGQSVYGSLGIDADQFSAMPSVHVGWAVIVAIAVITASRHRWRWLAVLYPALTTLVVVVTANHFWLDGIAAALLVAAALGVQWAAGRLRVRWLPRAGHSPAPAGSSEEKDRAGSTALLANRVCDVPARREIISPYPGNRLHHGITGGTAWRPNPRWPGPRPR